jgi:hypothetical protein
MKYVLDASVALCWVIPRPLTPKAVRLRNEYRRKIHGGEGHATHLQVGIASACRSELKPAGLRVGSYRWAQRRAGSTRKKLGRPA